MDWATIFILLIIVVIVVGLGLWYSERPAATPVEATTGASESDLTEENVEDLPDNHESEQSD